MSRNGTVTILGAGASADAGYPLASEFLQFFRSEVEKEGKYELKERERVRQEQERHEQEARNQPGTVSLSPNFAPTATTDKWFQEYWNRFEQIVGSLKSLAVPAALPNGRPKLMSTGLPSPTGSLSFPPYTDPVESQTLPKALPNLETFFSFYDDLLRPAIATATGIDVRSLRETQHRFRNLRSLAIKVAFRLLNARDRRPPSYLVKLLQLPGPVGHACAIATLNFDVAVEQLANEISWRLYDGFSDDKQFGEEPPPEWLHEETKNPHLLWCAINQNGHDWCGFRCVPSGTALLLKLHGSLGWYVLEEGGGDIGSREELRHNTAYRHFKIPYEWFWQLEKSLLEQLSSGGADDPVTRIENRSLSRKAGAIWVRPYLIFARSLKNHPDRLLLDLMAKFCELLRETALIITVGYSWGDTHINDLIFDEVARGASLVNISRKASDEGVLALWMHRFPTTFGLIRKRLFMFGGGAKQVIEAGKAELVSGPVEIDLIRLATQGLSEELSLASNGILQR